MIRRSWLLFSLLFASLNSFGADSPKIVEVPEGGFYLVKGVNVRNGNFAITYKTFQGNKDTSAFPFERVYNSQSEYKGAYGLGWGTQMDNAITFNADGSLWIKENGTGATTPYALKKDSVGQAYGSEKALMERYAIEVENQARIKKREAYYSAVKSGALPDRGPVELKLESFEPPADGSVFAVTTAFKGDVCRESSEIRRRGNNMIRVFSGQCPIASETYTLQGALVGVETREGSSGTTFSVTRDSQSKLVTSATNKNGELTRFQYDAKNRLISQEFASGESQRFEYDSRDNMTAIIYLDDSKQTMTYDERNRVVSVTPRRGPSASFEYLKDPYDPNISLTRVTITQDGKKEVAVFKLLN